MGVDATMFVKTATPVDALTVRKLAHRLKASFGGAVTVCRPGQCSWELEGRHALEIADEESLSAYGVEAKPGEVLEVNLSGRYYGKGYERGDLPTYIAIAEWIEINIPGAVVLYGGDTGEAVGSFGKDVRDELFHYFAAVAHEPYNNHFGRGARPTCDFCAGAPMPNYGGGGGLEYHRCDGCGDVALVSGARIRKHSRNELTESEKASWVRS